MRLMSKVDEVSKNEGLKINTSKTKIMIVDRPAEEELVPASIGGIEIVKEFIYLGAKLSNTGSCEAEIRRRIAMRKPAVVKLTRIWKDHEISRKMEMKLATLVFPIVTYAAESWTKNG